MLAALLTPAIADGLAFLWNYCAFNSGADLANACAASDPDVS